MRRVVPAFGLLLVLVVRTIRSGFGGAGSGPALRYRIEPGHWEMLTPDGLQVEVRRVAAGVERVILSHVQGVPTVLQTGDGTVTVLLEPQSGRDLRGALQVGEGGVAAVSVSRHGVLIDTEGNPLQRVVSRSGDAVELDCRAGAGLWCTAGHSRNR